ncbi:MAG: ASKHA domain-containing protein [Oscillospiraceae bacterium]|jgi:uncharacterized 2Fe-2S/4Fe-4S cluster protein (DUF4445 family)|nr:ASKHA domain-containing protein [Oscillospiraceae bacterium]
MANITFTFEDSRISPVCVSSHAGERLLDIARAAEVAIDAPCNGNGTCRKCKVSIDGKIVLACETVVPADDLTVLVPATAGAFKTDIRTADLSDPRELAIFEKTLSDLAEFPAGKLFTTELVTLEQPNLDDPTNDLERLLTAVNAEHIALSAIRQLPKALRSDGELALLRTKNTVLNIGSPVPEPLGIALDIGTTTVVMLLANLNTGEILSKASAGNAQIRYGADVIHRIVEAERPGGLDKLNNAIIEETIKPLMRKLYAEAGVSGEQVYRFVVSGNTTMNHLFLKIAPDFIRLEPYTPAFNRLGALNASDLGLDVHAHCKLIAAPNVGSYVGGDITAGTLTSLLWKRSSGNVLFADLGTNGELVFGNGEFMFTCACSAGPALEGGDMSCGMRATDGAIDEVTIDAETLEPAFSVIGGGEAKGLCGSGIIDAIAELFRVGAIDGKGKFVKSGSRITETDGIMSYTLSPGVEITEVDIDNFIRTKAAIFSAIRTMLNAVGFTVGDIDEVLIAGGIGSAINFDNAVRVGMFPAIALDKYRYVGNSSLSGAYAMLLSNEAARKVDELARSMTYIELSTDPGYMEEFVAACFLPHTDAGLFCG